MAAVQKNYSFLAATPQVIYGQDTRYARRVSAATMASGISHMPPPVDSVPGFGLDYIGSRFSQVDADDDKTTQSLSRSSTIKTVGSVYSTCTTISTLSSSTVRPNKSRLSPTRTDSTASSATARPRGPRAPSPRTSVTETPSSPTPVLVSAPAQVPSRPDPVTLAVAVATENPFSDSASPPAAAKLGKHERSLSASNRSSISSTATIVSPADLTDKPYDVEKASPPMLPMLPVLPSLSSDLSETHSPISPAFFPASTRTQSYTHAGEFSRFPGPLQHSPHGRTYSNATFPGHDRPPAPRRARDVPQDLALPRQAQSLYAPQASSQPTSPGPAHFSPGHARNVSNPFSSQPSSPGFGHFAQSQAASSPELLARMSIAYSPPHSRSPSYETPEWNAGALYAPASRDKVSFSVYSDSRPLLSRSEKGGDLEKHGRLANVGSMARRKDPLIAPIKVVQAICVLLVLGLIGVAVYGGIALNNKRNGANKSSP